MNEWKAKKFSAEAVAILEKYPWPGNIRELRNAVERLLLLADSEVDGDLSPRDNAPDLGRLREFVPQCSGTAL